MHTRAIFREFALRLQNNPVFSLPGAVEVVEEGTSSTSIPIVHKYKARLNSRPAIPPRAPVCR